jgi:hypothetical protein
MSSKGMTRVGGTKASAATGFDSSNRHVPAQSAACTEASEPRSSCRPPLPPQPNPSKVVSAGDRIPTTWLGQRNDKSGFRVTESSQRARAFWFAQPAREDVPQPGILFDQQNMDGHASLGHWCGLPWLVIQSDDKALSPNGSEPDRRKQNRDSQTAGCGTREPSHSGRSANSVSMTLGPLMACASIVRRPSSLLAWVTGSLSQVPGPSCLPISPRSRPS